MGCFSSKAGLKQEEREASAKAGGSFKRPKWRSDEPWTEQELQRKREEFWDTQPAYGGAKEVWDALRAVAQDLDNANNPLFLQAVGIKVTGGDLRSTYDERGFKYELPDFVLSAPTNLQQEAS